MKDSKRVLTPPRGWNSWDSYGTTVTEEEVLANAQFMAAHMLEFGWDTVVVDIQWYEPNAKAHGYNHDADVLLDEFGSPQPVPNRFPSAANGRGFAPLAQTIHDLGLKFGVHVMRGIPRRAAAERLPIEGKSSTAADVADLDNTCAWNQDNYGLDQSHPDAAAYYLSLARLFNEWGVDFVKVDDMLFPYHAAEIAAFAAAFREVNPAILISLSPGEDVSTAYADHLKQNASMWRISNDLWDRWQDVLDQFQRMARWAPLSRPSAWPDADMLPLGHIGLRAERGDDRHSLLAYSEQRTLLTLWAISGSPLFMGGDLPTSTSKTIDLLTNPLMLDVNARREGQREVLREADYALWTATLDGNPILAVFNTGAQPLRRHFRLDLFGLQGAFNAREAWTGTSQIAEHALSIDLDAHDAALFQLRAP